VTNLADAGPGSLRDAIAATLLGGTVDFQPGLSGAIALTSATLAITQDLGIAGPGADVITVSGQSLFQVFNIASGATVTISGLTIANGSSSDGGGIANNGTLAIIACTLPNNGPGIFAGANFRGGGVFNTGALTILGSTFSSNCAGSEGGGIYNAGTLTISTSAFTGNCAFGYGGGIYNAGTLTVSDCTLSSNTAGDGGGGGLFNGGTATIRASTLSQNLLNAHVGQGGGIANWGKLMLTDSSVLNNVAGRKGQGGGIYNAGTLMVIASAIRSNTAAAFDDGGVGSGGGIYNERSGNLTVFESTLSGNTASGTVEAPFSGFGFGGGIYNAGTLSLTNSTLSGNSAEGGVGFRSTSNSPAGASGGGIFNAGTLTVLNSTFGGNYVQGFGYSGNGGSSNGYANGGAIANTGTLLVLESTFSGNSVQAVGGSTASGSFGGDAAGGGFYNAGVLTILESTLSGNSASFLTMGTAVGGGIANETAMAGTTSIQNSIIAGNTAPASSDVNGSLKSLGYNLIGVGDGGSGYAVTDLVGTSTSPLDPKLGPLQDNGGPTPTLALLPGSPAIDAGAPSDSEWDQRGPGYQRLVNGATDIGAYEVQQPPSPDRVLRAAGFLDAAGLVVDTESSPPPARAFTSRIVLPGRPLRLAVAAADQVFASLFIQPARLPLSRFRPDVPGEAETWPLVLLPMDVIT
jgi:hypothetical protein